MKMYCVKCKQKFEAKTTKTVTRKGRNFAVAKHSCGTEAWRILGK